MKKILLLSFLFSFNLGNAQITIDSFAVYNTGVILDSFYVKTTSQGQILKLIDIPTHPDACGTATALGLFIGCETGSPLAMDTMVSYGYYCKKMFFTAFWDTSYTCTIPLQATYMDCVVWNQCDNFGFDEFILENSISLYPNPTNGILNIQSSEVEIEEIQLYDQLGRKLKKFGKLEKTIDISELPEGVLFVEIETDKGTLTKRIVLTRN